MKQVLVLVAAAVAVLGLAACEPWVTFNETPAQKEFRLFQEKCKANPELKECVDDANMRKP